MLDLKTQTLNELTTWDSDSWEYCEVHRGVCLSTCWEVIQARRPLLPIYIYILIIIFKFYSTGGFFPPSQGRKSLFLRTYAPLYKQNLLQCIGTTHFCHSHQRAPNLTFGRRQLTVEIHCYTTQGGSSNPLSEVFLQSLGRMH